MANLFPDNYEASLSRFILDFHGLAARWPGASLESYVLKSNSALLFISRPCLCFLRIALVQGEQKSWNLV